MTITTCMMTAAMLAVAAAGAFAGSKEHHGDVVITVDDGRLMTATEHKGKLEPERVFGGELGKVIPGFGDEPGFEAVSLPAFTRVGFDILDAARVWNGGDFDLLSSGTFTLELAPGVPGSPSATTPIVPGVVPGFVFGTADEEGGFHQHIGMMLNAPAGEGVYLLQLRLLSPADTSGILAPSEPFWLVLSNGADEKAHDAAMEYVRSVIVPAPGAGVGVLLVGVMGLRRRRGLRSDQQATQGARQGAVSRRTQGAGD